MCFFFKELTEILGKRHNIVPLVVSDRDGFKVRKEVPNIVGNTSDKRLIE